MVQGVDRPAIQAIAQISLLEIADCAFFTLRLLILTFDVKPGYLY